MADIRNAFIRLLSLAIPPTMYRRRRTQYPEHFSLAGTQYLNQLWNEDPSLRVYLDETSNARLATLQSDFRAAYNSGRAEEFVDHVLPILTLVTEAVAIDRDIRNDVSLWSHESRVLRPSTLLAIEQQSPDPANPQPIPWGPRIVRQDIVDRMTALGGHLPPDEEEHLSQSFATQASSQDSADTPAVVPSLRSQLTPRSATRDSLVSPADGRARDMDLVPASSAAARSGHLQAQDTGHGSRSSSGSRQREHHPHRSSTRDSQVDARGHEPSSSTHRGPSPQSSRQGPTRESRTGNRSPSQHRQDSRASSRSSTTSDSAVTPPHVLVPHQAYLPIGVPVPPQLLDAALAPQAPPVAQQVQRRRRGLQTAICSRRGTRGHRR